MKSFVKCFAATAAVLALIVGGMAYAGINPATYGLPSIKPSEVGYGTTGTPDNAVCSKEGSIICVACHKRNPSPFIAAPSDQTGVPDATRLGSHWVTRNFNDTHSSGGYTDSRARATLGVYLHRGPWRTSGSSDGLVSTGVSKYGQLTGGSGAVTTIQPAATASIADNNYQMICESCHNIKKNVGPRKLLGLAVANHTLADNGALLCAGCHGDMRTTLNQEPPYFTSVAAPGYLQEHHKNVMTTTATTYYTGTVVTPPATLPAYTIAANIAAADYLANTDNASRTWAVGPGALLAAGTTTRAVGTWDVNLAAQNRLKLRAGGVIHCQNCHRAHNAVSSTGSLIVQSGTGSTSFGLLTSAGQVSPQTEWLVRQTDAGSPKSTATKLIQDDQGLCSACHTGK